MQIPNNQDQVSIWFKEVRDFFTEKDVKSITEMLLETYLNSHYANCQKSRTKVYFFIKKMQACPLNQQN